jgi:N-acetylglucosaminyl-diphospho-decaprenol L-rhamnosyltransferase
LILSIIIVNYNVKYFLEQCLHSVQKAGEGLDIEIIVIDNASTDGSREWLQHKFPQVKFHWLATNLGFGKANNLALKEATGDYILFLNPDTIIAEDSLRLCLAEKTKDKNIGALGVRMIDGSGSFLKESKRGLPTASAAFYKFTGLCKLFPHSKKIAAYYAGHLPQQQSHDVEVLSGAFMMLSRKAIEITKGFVEDFFMYGEDVDLSYRITKAGLKCRYFAGTTIIHFKGESTQKNSPGYSKHFYGAMLLFVKKHFADKKAMIFFTRLAVTAAGTFTALKKKNTGNKNSSNKPLRTAAIASQAVFDQCVQLLKYAITPVSIIGRIDPVDDKTNRSLGNLDQTAALIKKNKIEQLVFCSASSPVIQIIKTAEEIGRKTQLLFWMEGSASMVGSNKKNQRGKFIAAPLQTSHEPANH